MIVIAAPIAVLARRHHPEKLAHERVHVGSAFVSTSLKLLREFTFESCSTPLPVANTL